MIDAGISYKRGTEVSVFHVELLALKHSLSHLEVGPGQSLDLLRLQGAVVVVEALGASAGGSGQISEILELPVSPAGEVVVANVSNGVDFLDTGRGVEAGSEFRYDQGHIVSFSILSSCAHSVFVPIIALLSFVQGRLSCGAHISGQLAAVSVVIEHMKIGIFGTARGFCESEMEHEAAQDSNLVGELGGFEEHDL